ncbi:hypothetical protein IT417_03220 [bacterium]|nr:hypothetical protein [bacterium]
MFKKLLIPVAMFAILAVSFMPVRAETEEITLEEYKRLYQTEENTTPPAENEQLYQTQEDTATPQDYYQNLYDSFGDASDNYDYNYDYSYENLSPDEQAALAGLFAVWGGAMFAVLGVAVVVGLILYIYSSWALMVIGNKIGIKDSWWAWVPILNLVFLCRVAEINPWTVLLIIIPGVNGLYMLVLMVLAAMKMSEKRGLDKMLGLLILIPLVNYIFIGYLAWGKITPKSGAPAQRAQA